MELLRIYECFCDRTRLRILQLLLNGPLCVCHVQAALREGQVKISKHLRYLKSRGLVEARREGAWIVYQLPVRRSGELDRNLGCLQDCATADPVFAADMARLKKLDLGCAVERRRAPRRSGAH